MPVKMDLKLLRANDVAEILRVSPKTVHQLVREGKLCCVETTPKLRRFLPDQVVDFIESRRRPMPKKVDKKPSKPVGFIKKGGDSRKSVEDSGTDLRKEIRELWR